MKATLPDELATLARHHESIRILIAATHRRESGELLTEQEHHAIRSAVQAHALLQTT